MKATDITSGLTQGVLKSRLSYDAETGLFRWLATGPNRHAGDIAGCLQKSTGYWLIRVGGRKYHASRLAWLFMTGEWPDEAIDHVSGARADNRWSNLRQATKSQNGANRGTDRRNTSGFKGAFYKKDRDLWFAAIRANGRLKHLGYFSSKEGASAAYSNAAKEIFGSYARSS